MVSHEAKEVTEVRKVLAVWGYVSIANVILFLIGIFSNQWLFIILPVLISMGIGSVTRQLRDELTKLTDLERG